MNRKMMAALLLVAVPTAAWAAPKAYGANDHSIGSWDICSLRSQAIAHAKPWYPLSWHPCYPE